MEKWLQTALALGRIAARLHLARPAFDAGPEDTALAHLQDYLSWCMERGRSQCAGCDQRVAGTRKCSRVEAAALRGFACCSAQDHQKMASKSVASGGSLVAGRHQDVCDVMGKWRQQVDNDGMSPDVWRADLLVFLRLEGRGLRTTERVPVNNAHSVASPGHTG